AAGRHRVETIPMALVAVVAALIAFRRSRWRSDHTLRLRHPLITTLRWIVTLAVTGIVLVDAVFIVIFDPLSNAPWREIFGEESPDLSRLAWQDAFERLHGHLSRAYALGAWKRIDWPALHDAAGPKIAAAAGAHDRAAYYTALREYLWSLHDGHVGLAGDDEGLRIAATRGGYGFAMIRLDDGRTIAHVVIDDGPAMKQGRRWGATLIRWKGVPSDEAGARISVLWNASPPATVTGLSLARLRLLSRAPVGTRATVAFRNLDEAESREATLEAVDDDFEPLKRSG